MLATKNNLVLLLINFALFNSFSKAQYFNQNGTTAPYPYQSVLGLPPNQPVPQNMGIPSVGVPLPYPTLGNQWSPMVVPNVTQNSNMYGQLAQQGIPAYQYPLVMGLPQAGVGYPQAFGYVPPNIGYPQPLYGMGMGYPQQSMAFPQVALGYPQRTLGYPNMGNMGLNYPQQGVGQAQVSTSYPQNQQGNAAQLQNYGDPYANINTEILDVSPEYQRKMLGWPEEGSSTGGINGNGTTSGSSTQGIYRGQPEYDVKIDSQTTNFTSLPTNLTKPIVTVKNYTTSIRRTFVYDSSKPGKIEPINLHFINGEQVTTTPPPTTTENEDVEDKNVSKKGRRFMDVPKSCPRGTLPGHKGVCMEPFFLSGLSMPKSESMESTTQVQDENSIVN